MRADQRLPQTVKAGSEIDASVSLVRYVEVEWQADAGTIILQVNMNTLADLHLGIGVSDVVRILYSQRKLKLAAGGISVDKDRIYIHIDHAPDKSTRISATRNKATDDSGDLLRKANFLCREVRTVPISGYLEAARALIETSEEDTHRVVVEGYGLRACMNTEGVIGTQTRTNSVMECVEVLGIEAARTTIADEIEEVMGYMGIDPRHIQLLADVMTYKGEVLGITRFGLAKAKDSVLHLASFEKTADHLFDAVAAMKIDRIEGVSESIILGQPIPGGTGTFQVVRRLGVPSTETGPKPTLFEDAWNGKLKMRRQKERR